MDEDAALFGVTMPDMDEIEATNFEVLEENWSVVEAILILDDCAWQISGMGDLIGLDYSAAHIIWGYAGIKPNQDVFMGLMLFAKTVVNELNKRKK